MRKTSSIVYKKFIVFETRQIESYQFKNENTMTDKTSLKILSIVSELKTVDKYNGLLNLVLLLTFG